MSGDLEGYLGCAPWGSQSIPSEMRLCAMCQTQICLSKSNVARARKLVKICVPCLRELFPDIGPGPDAPGLVGGKIYDDVGAAMLAALAELGRN